MGQCASSLMFWLLIHPRARWEGSATICKHSKVTWLLFFLSFSALLFHFHFSVPVWFFLFTFILCFNFLSSPIDEAGWIKMACCPQTTLQLIHKSLRAAIHFLPCQIWKTKKQILNGMFSPSNTKGHSVLIPASLSSVIVSSFIPFPLSPSHLPPSLHHGFHLSLPSPHLSLLLSFVLTFSSFFPPPSFPSV